MALVGKEYFIRCKVLQNTVAEYQGVPHKIGQQASSPDEAGAGSAYAQVIEHGNDVTGFGVVGAWVVSVED